MEFERNESVGPLINDLRVQEVGKYKAERKTSAVTHQYEVDMAAKNNQINKQELEIKALTCHVEVFMKESIALEQKVMALAVENENLAELDSLLEDLEKHQDQMVDLLSEKANCSKIDALNDELDKLFKKLAESDSLCNFTKAELDAKLMALDEMMKSNSELIESLKKEQGSIVDLRSKNASLKDELDELAKKLAERESLYNSAKAELDLNLMAIDDMTKKEASDSELIKSLEKEQDSNAVHMGKQMEKLTSLGSQNAALKQELDQLANLKQENQLIRSEKDQLELKIKSLEAKLSLLEQDRMTGLKKLQNAESQLANLESDLRKSEFKSKDLEMKLSQKERGPTTTPLGKLLFKY